MSTVVGLVLWALLIWAARAAARWGRKRQGAVSGNAEPTSGTGPAWEQDEPYALMIDYDREDDDL